jgi:2-polyprenyl-6-methoxyphenol hydroxylase-like FAD-dependent oxidoreductase
MPEAAAAVSGVTSVDQLLYQEPAVLRAARWWSPGVVLIGDAAHFFGPETGVGAALGVGDAHALAEAIAQEPADPDAACARYEAWRAPVIRPYEAADPAAGRMALPNAERPPEERWPPA